MAEHYLGLLEFAAEAVHQAPGLGVESLQVGVGHRLVRYPAAHRRLRVRQRRLVRPLLLELGHVLVVERLQLDAGAADGAGGCGEGVVVRGGRVVGALHLLDEVVEFAQVRLGGGVGRRWPRLGQAAPVLLQPPEVGL
ncbi:hypothetical protein [Micromonospora sp. MW-13]|uniref:hypothetical protein n=1 Tax=Micromonospora sp. MW-13 TaxID=2094022 RepID=UPI00140455B5